MRWFGQGADDWMSHVEMEGGGGRDVWALTGARRLGESGEDDI